MCERLDLELRVYLTGRPGGQLEWSVTAVEDGGQCTFEDGGISPYRAGQATLPSTLGRAVSLVLRRQANQIRQYEGPRQP